MGERTAPTACSLLYMSMRGSVSEDDEGLRGLQRERNRERVSERQRERDTQREIK